MGRSGQRALLLAFAGLASGLLATPGDNLASGLRWFYPGLVFGVAIAAVFVYHGGAWSPSKPIAFIAASSAAYAISFEAAA
jgi:hypothetical protein